MISGAGAISGRSWSFGVERARGRLHRVTRCACLGTIDGRLVALDRKTGAPVWSVQTTPKDGPYAISGAPRIAGGRVVIGNAGSEFAVRGFVSAHDAGAGALAWRTSMVPGDPSKPFESEALRRAAATWSGKWWKAGGGASPWGPIVYDPALDLLNVGTGNANPWYPELRGDREGDNLYASSIVALRASTGEIVWHYQTTPGDAWDFDATQPITLADLVIDGRPRKVLMQPNKNAFLYVSDRATGALISARRASVHEARCDRVARPAGVVRGPGDELRDDIYLDPRQIIPRPMVKGTLTSVRIEDTLLVQEFARTADDTIFGTFVKPDSGSRTFVYFRGGTLRFGNLTMTDTDLLIHDADGRDPFDLYFAEYGRQLVAGHTNNLPNLGLRTWMVDYGKLEAAGGHSVALVGGMAAGTRP